jgi:hypothetical protein
MEATSFGTDTWHREGADMAGIWEEECFTMKLLIVN